MARMLHPGPASMEGLAWLARVGPSPLDPWRHAMGWSEVAARHHARRLEKEGWLARCPMTRGQGSLFLATRTGVQMVRLPLVAASPPAPTWWAHHSGCAWAAAYLTVRGRDFLGPRELLGDPYWSGDLYWVDRHSSKRSGHHPDLVGMLGEGHIGIEVELAPKSRVRLAAILRLHHAWALARKTDATIYICGDQSGAERIHRVAYENALVDRDGSRWLNIRLLETLKEQTETGADKVRAARNSSRVSEPQPVGARNG
jgi:hypothetical protein